MQHPKSVGIDLGTTNSAVAVIDASGRSTMVPNSEGDLLTPSIVLFGDTEVVVGKEARSAATVSPDRVAQWVKRDMGSPVYSRPIRGEHLPPEVIQACILRKLKADLVKSEGPDCQVVITVPAYFDEPRRKATADAGEMAGLNVLDIVNEPTAAALSFAETLGLLTPGTASREEMTVLVYDLGGGTFDVTVLRLAPGNVQTIATDGDVQLGGYDWDGRLVDYMAEAFLRRYRVDPREDPTGLNRLYNATVEAKHTLTARNRATIRIEHAGNTFERQITRRQFDEMTGDLLERTAHTTRELMQAAKMDFGSLSRVLLVGGSTRMPMVGEMLRRMTGIVPDRTVNPDEAVARGAALYAAFLLAQQSPSGPPAGFQVTNVNAHSLGIEGIDQATLRKTNVVLIPRNTPLPAMATERFVTKSKGQRSIVVQVLQGESSLPGECTAIGRTVVRDLPGDLPQGWPVEVMFEYGSNGRLSIRAVVPGTHQEAALELERARDQQGGGRTDELFARWKQPVDAAAGFGTFESTSRQAAGTAAAGTRIAEAAPSGPTPPSPSPPSPSPQTPSLPTAPPTPAAAVPPVPAAVPSAPAAAESPGLEPAGGPGVPTPMPSAAATPAEQPSPRRHAPTARKSNIPRWFITLIGYITSAIVGLGAGYVVLHLLRPESFPMPW